jgi:hypothetical protein
LARIAEGEPGLARRSVHSAPPGRTT